MQFFQFLFRHEWDWQNRDTLGYRAPPRDPLTMFQYEIFRGRVPSLYFVLAVISVAAAVVAKGQVFSALQFAIPGLLLAASIIRFVMWKKRFSTEVTPDEARTQLARTFWITIVLISAASVWTLSGFYETDQARRLLPPMFAALGAIATASCLTILPRAAFASLIIGIGPISCAMLFSGQPELFATGTALAVVAIFQGRLIIGQFATVGRNVQLRTQLARLADVDPLTGLCNRRAFDRELHNALVRGEPFVVTMLDLDRFKPVNDTHGHAVGDKLLRAVGRRLEANLRQHDMVARLGGDEFALILRGPPEAGTLPKWRNRLEAQLSAPYRLGDLDLTVSASLGTAHFPDEATTADDLCAHADAMLYRAKEAAQSELTRISRARHSSDAAATPMARRG